MHLLAPHSGMLCESRRSVAIVLLLLSSIFHCPVSPAQQVQAAPPDAVEQMEAVFDTAVIYQPQPGQFGITELMNAVMNQDTPTVAALIDAGADVNAADDWGSTALMGAAFHGPVDIVRLLLADGADANAVADDGKHALGHAVGGKQTAIVIELLNYGANPIGLTTYERPLLQFAAVTGQADVVDALIAHGVDIERYGPAALGDAAWKGYTRIATALISAGVDVNATTGNYYSVPLYAAASSGNVELVSLLLAHGADVDVRNERDQSALTVATGGDHTEVVQVLLASNATVTPADLSVAIEAGNGTMTQALLEGLDTYALSRTEIDTLLFVADQAGEEAVLEALFNAAAAPEIDDRSVRLLYRPQHDEGCNFQLWDPRRDKQKTVYASDKDCPEYVFVSDGSDEMFLVEDDKVHVVPLDKKNADYVLELPLDQIRSRQANLAIQTQTWVGGNYEGVYASLTPRPAAVGHLETGELGVVMHSYGPADGTNAYLYAWYGDSWKLVEEKGCHRFDACHYARLDGRHIRHWPLHRTAWHPYLRKNKFFVGKEILWRPGDEWSDRHAAIRFSIDDQQSTVTYASRESGHCIGDCRYTTRLELQPADGDPVILTNHSGNNSIAGRYVLVHDPSGKLTQLIELETGKSVFGRIGHSTWIE